MCGGINPQAAGPNMRDSKLSRRDMLGATTVLTTGVVFAEPLAAAAPEPTPLRPAMIQAARKEGTLAFYTAMAIPVAENLSKAFEAKYPGIKVRLKRSGAERVFQRIGKEEEIRIHEVDVVCSTDAGHFVRWRREGLLAPFLPEDAAKHLPPKQIGADGMYATRRHSPRSAQLATTPIWSSPRIPRRLSPICSTPHGRAKSSKEIRTTAAPSLPRRLRSRASWAGPISRGSPSRRSCRWSHRAIHRIGSPAARVPCKPTVPTPNSCCCESEARRWKLSTPARARR